MPRTLKWAPRRKPPGWAMNAAREIASALEEFQAEYPGEEIPIPEIAECIDKHHRNFERESGARSSKKKVSKK